MTSNLTPEQKEYDAELRKRAGVNAPVPFDLIHAMLQAVSEGHVVDVRAQPFMLDEPMHWTVRLHPTPNHPFGVSFDGTDWRECFVRCFRQADELAAQQLAELGRQP